MGNTNTTTKPTQSYQKGSQAPPPVITLPLTPPTTTRPPLICSDYLTKDKCNNIDNCYYSNFTCNNTTNFTKLSSIPDSDIIFSIIPNISQSSETYTLYCINKNLNKNILIKSIGINCNDVYNNTCNILLPSAITTQKEFAIKPYLQTFNNIGELSNPPSITLEQIDLLRLNNNEIILIDIYDDIKRIQIPEKNIFNNNNTTNAYLQSNIQNINDSKSDINNTNNNIIDIINQSINTNTS